MSCTGTSYRCNAWQPPVAVEAGFGLLTVWPFPRILDGSLTQARSLPSGRPYLPRDAALSAVLDRMRPIYLVGISAVPTPRGFGGPDMLSARTVADGVGCEDSAALIEATQRGEPAAIYA